MQKIFKLFVLLLVVFGLTACKKTEPEKPKDKDFLTMLVNTQKEYTNSESVNVVMVVVKDGITTTSELVYNFDDSSIVNLAHKFVDGDTVYEAYVKNGNAYVNINGDKSQGTLFDMEAEEVINNYAFKDVTAVIFDTFDKSLMKAFVVNEDKDGVVKLTWDPTKYVLITDGLSDEELEIAMTRFTEIQAKISEINLTINYANEKVTKLESTWLNKDNKTSSISIEFKGTSAQEIEYPSDLDTYPER